MEEEKIERISRYDEQIMILRCTDNVFLSLAMEVPLIYALEMSKKYVSIDDDKIDAFKTHLISAQKNIHAILDDAKEGQNDTD